MEWYFGMSEDEAAYFGWEEVIPILEAQDADDFREQRWNMENPTLTQDE